MKLVVLIAQVMMVTSQSLYLSSAQYHNRDGITLYSTYQVPLDGSGWIKVTDNGNVTGNVLQNYHEIINDINWKTGDLFFAQLWENNVYCTHLATHSASQVISIDSGWLIEGLAVNPRTSKLYLAVDGQGSPSYIIELDPSTGNQTWMGRVPRGSFDGRMTTPMAFNSEHTILYFPVLDLQYVTALGSFNVETKQFLPVIEINGERDFQWWIKMFIQQSTGSIFLAGYYIMNNNPLLSQLQSGDLKQSLLNQPTYTRLNWAFDESNFYFIYTNQTDSGESHGIATYNLANGSIKEVPIQQEIDWLYDVGSLSYYDGPA
eukprot:TRINITY_DN2265_c0_g1_i2.p1 TRINITY_DN2265_c0_g1~~TRINITY_DN2265_c0_g1_i2.p1  ORF type:complete len:330 (+),score=75.76 TRINITY_DN2265_c0_g1_i2:39-992(+)